MSVGRSTGSVSSVARSSSVNGGSGPSWSWTACSIAGSKVVMVSGLLLYRCFGGGQVRLDEVEVRALQHAQLFDGLSLQTGFGLHERVDRRLQEVLVGFGDHAVPHDGRQLVEQVHRVVHRGAAEGVEDGAQLVVEILLAVGERELVLELPVLVVGLPEHAGVALWRRSVELPDDVPGGRPQ